MVQRTDWIGEELGELQRQGLLRHLQVRESPPVSGMVQIDGQSLINFGSNDYLGLAADVRLVDAVKQFSGQLGWGAGASAVVNGRGALHCRLENELAQFSQSESALLFPTGFAANVGVITSLVRQGDQVFSDQLNHASIIDGCRLSGAAINIYRHSDIDHLAELLATSSASGRRLIVTDSIFSMDGDLAPLEEIARLAEQYGAMFVVDEAHATGVLGDKGRGACEQLNVESAVDVRVGTLSKALGSMGGYVSGSHDLIQWIYNRARSYMFSTAQPEAISAASLAALKVVQSEPQRREKLLKMSDQLRRRIKEIGFNVANSSTQIIPILIGDNQAVVKLSQKLRSEGLFIPAIRPPAVLDGKARLRISLTSQHQSDQLDRLCECLAGL